MRRGRGKKPLRFRRVPHPTMSKPCIVPVSHGRTKNGYVRITPRGAKNNSVKYLHRIVYEARHGIGSIPEGFQVDHICRTRDCCNPSHLQLLSASEHARVTFAAHYDEDREAVWTHWVYYRNTPAELAEIYGFKARTIAGWIKEWSEELQAA